MSFSSTVQDFDIKFFSQPVKLPKGFIFKQKKTALSFLDKSTPMFSSSTREEVLTLAHQKLLESFDVMGEVHTLGKTQTSFLVVRAESKVCMALGSPKRGKSVTVTLWYHLKSSEKPPYDKIFL